MARMIHRAIQRVRDWNDRRIAIMTLSAMNDYQLADIGIERGAVVEAVRGTLPHLQAGRS